MPNHVYQTATFTIPDPEVRATIIGLAEKGESILRHYLPITKVPSANYAHAAALEMWGTKWADYETALQDTTGNEVNVSFTSAWGPADIGLIKIAALLDIHITLFWQEEQPSDIGCAIFDGKNGATWAKQYYGDALDAALVRLGSTPYPEQEGIDTIDPATGMSPLDTFYQNQSDAEHALIDELDTELYEHLAPSLAP